MDNLKITKEEKEKYEMSLNEIEEIEEETDINFFNLISDMGKEKFPKASIMKKIVEKKDKVNNFSELTEKFVKVMVATTKKKQAD